MQTKIHWTKTAKTPEIILDKENNIFKIEGRSLSENPRSFFEPIFSWFKQYIQSPNEKTHIEINLEYINSASTRALLQIFVILKEIPDAENKVNISWFYEDEDEEMKEKGDEVLAIVKLPHQLIPIEL